MAVSNIKAVFQCDVKKVWDIVTDLERYSWRSDLDRIEIISDTQFIEYTKDEYATTFTVTVAKPCERWEFELENDNMKGHWIGIFSQNGNETTVDFTENVSARKFWMKPFVKMFLKKQQTAYIADLKKVIEQ